MVVILRRLPMDEKGFWLMIEEAWGDGAAAARKKFVQGKLSEEGAMKLADLSQSDMVPALREKLEQLPKEELLQFDRILERKLYDIDRAEIQEYTDGGDDGFLYARGFIVAAGQAYYEKVSSDPACAGMDLECEEMCYLSARVYEDRFGKMPNSDISRETGFNKSGWPKSTK
jgi:hypothetical protein